MRRRATRTRCGLAVAWTAILLTACIERTEKLTVEPDGTVMIEASFSTGSWGELYEGDAVPSLAGGWLVEESVELDDEGREHYRLVAEAIFPPDVELPESFAPPGDPQAELSLRFPTEVMIEERPDGIYYHFHRLYPRREWVHVESLQERLVDEPLENLRAKKPEDLTRAERALSLSALADFEVAKMLAFARKAFLEVTPEAPQDGWLDVHAAMEALKAEIDFDRLAALSEIEDEKERDSLLTPELKRWEEKAARRLEVSLRRFCGYGGTQMSDFLNRFERQRRSFEITQDLGDDNFQITVVMPGEIVGSNADSSAGDRATWKFSGKRFRDQDLELMVSSRVAAP